MLDTLTSRRALLGAAALLSLLAGPARAQYPVLQAVAPVVGRLDGYTTDLYVANGTRSPGTVNLVYRYQSGALQGTASTSITVAGRQTLTVTDLIGSRFGLYDNTLGRLEVEFNENLLVQPVVKYLNQEASAPVVWWTCSARMAQGASLDEPYAVRDAYSSTKLLLSETGDAWSDVTVQLVDSSSGGILGERVYSLAPNEVMLVVDVFGESGVGLPPGDYSGVTIRVSPTGPGRVLATRMWVDQLYNAMDFHVVGSDQSSGPNGTIGF